MNKKTYVVMFGGTPERADMCMLLNCAAGVTGGSEIHSIVIDKDVNSPNYINSRNLYAQYRKFRDAAGDEGIASADVIRGESLFEKMLEEAGMDPANESIRYVLAQGGRLTEGDRRALDICFTREEQNENLEGGYYGKANIGAVTSEVLIDKGIYQMLGAYAEIVDTMQSGIAVDVIIICSSFGGTGASLGINFGEFLNSAIEDRRMLRLHCIHIQPYFSFQKPDPAQKEKHQIDYERFYAKSAAVTNLLGSRRDLLRTNEGTGIFDSFYYLGQGVLDKISDYNSPVGGQDNRLHIVDMLVSLAVDDIIRGNGGGPDYKLIGYQYSHSGTNYISWDQMPQNISFKEKHVNFMRFCAFMIDCLEPIFETGFAGYDRQALIVYLYGGKGVITPTARLKKQTDDELRESLGSCFAFCRSYVKYWLEMEDSTKFGNASDSVSRFFKQEAVKKILNIKDQSKYMELWGRIFLDELTDMDEYRNYKTDDSYLSVYDRLCRNRKLRKAAGSEINGREVASLLIKAAYEECSVR